MITIKSKDKDLAKIVNRRAWQSYEKPQWALSKNAKLLKKILFLSPKGNNWGLRNLTFLNQEVTSKILIEIIYLNGFLLPAGEVVCFVGIYGFFMSTSSIDTT